MAPCAPAIIRSKEFMSFSPVTESAGTNLVRLKRQLTEQAIAAATGADWAAAAEINRRILELGPDSPAENRLAKAHWELGELGEARVHYQAALALDPTNRIAERNIDRLRVLLAEAGERTVPAAQGSKAPVSIFVEETGKTGFAGLYDLPTPRQLAQVNPGDLVELVPQDYDILFNLAVLLADSDRPREALPYLRKFLDEAPPGRYAEDLALVRKRIAEVERTSR